MNPPLAMDALDRQMVGGQGDVAAERMRRLHAFRQQHQGMSMFYRLLDVPYGIDRTYAVGSTCGTIRR